MRIPIFRAEADIAEQLSDNVISYAAAIEQVEEETKQRVLASSDAYKASAALGDVYVVKALLASTVWNRNDDIFDRVETWQARHTPVNKPSNISHDEHKIIGHMTNSWVIDDDGADIPDDALISDLPDLYHVCVGSVIYTAWEDEGIQTEVDGLIKSVASGEKYVSMECVFRNFDYGLEDESGQLHIIARAEDTAFLTKHLRIYKGSGEYNGCKLGRIPRNFSFSGKGFVDKPANPDSIIFSESRLLQFADASYKNPFIERDGVYLLRGSSFREETTEPKTKEENLNMSEDALKEVKSENQELKSAIETLKAQLAEQDKAGFEKTIAGLKTQLSDSDSKVTDLGTELETTKAQVTDLTGKLEEANTAKAEMEKEIADSKAEKAKAERISTLVDGGVAKETAVEKVGLFEGLNDEQFGAVASELIAAVKAQKPKETEQTETAKAEETSETDDSSAESTTEESLETAEAEEKTPVSPAGDREDEEAGAMRKSIAEALGSRWFGETKEEESE